MWLLKNKHYANKKHEYWVTAQYSFYNEGNKLLGSRLKINTTITNKMTIKWPTASKLYNDGNGLLHDHRIQTYQKFRHSKNRVDTQFTAEDSVHHMNSHQG
jgi:hypothetical protein